MFCSLAHTIWIIERNHKADAKGRNYYLTLPSLGTADWGFTAHIGTFSETVPSTNVYVSAIACHHRPEGGTPRGHTRGLKPESQPNARVSFMTSIILHDGDRIEYNITFN